MRRSVHWAWGRKMINLSQVQPQSKIWRPAIRRMGISASPSALPFTVLDVRKDESVYFVSLEDEREIAYTIAFSSPTGLVDDFHSEELLAVKDAFMRTHSHSGEMVQTKKSLTFFAGSVFGIGFFYLLNSLADFVASF